MTGMSLLRPCLRQGFRIAFNNGKLVLTPLQRQVQLQGQVSVRNGGHQNNMPIVPSSYEWTRYKDSLHFYLLLGFVPMLTFITLVNIFIGPAEFAEIPEGYEPKEWEYYQSPIRRWFVKYVYEEPQKEYERTLHLIHSKQESRYWKQLEKKVRSLQKDRLDYKGWYWVEADKSLVDAQKAYAENELKLRGYK